MSLQEHAGIDHVIDLRRGPSTDLSRSSYFSSNHVSLEEAANRLLLSRAWSTPTYLSRRPAKARRQINLLTIAMTTAFAAVGIALIGLVASTQY